MPSSVNSFRVGNPIMANRIFNFVTNHRRAPVPPPIVPGTLKAIFFLELSAGIVQIANSGLTTLNYYWDNYPQEFERCPYVDTKGDLSIVLTLLDEYYNRGFRYFLGFGRSTIFQGVMSWFNIHADATCMCPYANASALSVPKNMYRCSYDNTNFIQPILPQILAATNVYYIYDANELGASDMLTVLQAQGVTNIMQYPVSADAHELTVSGVSTFLAGATAGDVLLTMLFVNNTRPTYINLFSTTNGLTFAHPQYDLSVAIPPVIPDDCANALTGKYNMLMFEGCSTSILWRNGFNALGASTFVSIILNMLNMLNTFSNTNNQHEEIVNINSHYASFQFDPVTRDMLYSNVLVETYVLNSETNVGSFNANYLYVQDPFLGIYNASFEGNTYVAPSQIIPVAKNTTTNPGKVIALLELTNSIQNNDEILKESLYYYWFQNGTLPKFPIVDTTSSVAMTITLLESYYNQGYRIFLGFNRSTVFGNADVVSWFTSHPLATAIAVLGSATLTGIPNNMFRLQIQDADVISMFVGLLQPATKIYYFYTENDVTGATILGILQRIYGAKVDPFMVAEDNSNLTVINVNAYFSNGGNLSTDMVVLFLLGFQEYINLYANGLNPVNALQYSTASQTMQVIVPSGARAALNEKLFILQPTFPNTSLLWNNNKNYLENKHGAGASSYGLINALTMIQYMLAGKDIHLLGSHFGTLQFNPTNKTLLYPSALLTQYISSSNAFENYSITFRDPLLGSFEASFV